MTRFRILALGALFLAAACTPSIPQTSSVSSVTTIEFDPTTGQIPSPNALDFSAQALASLPAGAQKDLLEAFAAAGGFPNDQEVPVTFGLVEQDIAASGTVTTAGPQLDVTSFTPTTFFVFAATSAGVGIVKTAPITAADVTVGTTGSTLTIHNLNDQPWLPGLYYVGIRGGASGIQTSNGQPVYPSQVFALVAQGQDMTLPQNIALLEAQLGNPTLALQQAEALNGLILEYESSPGNGLPSPFAVTDSVFPHQELAGLTEFSIAPAVTQIELDPARNLAPLPIDLLRSPGPTGTITLVGACGLAGGTINASGVCSSAGAAGFEALDGFGTTAAILAPTNALIQANTVTGGTLAAPGTVQLYDLTNPATPALVDPSTLVFEPVEVTQSGVSQAIVIEPAGVTGGDATSPFRTKPLKDATDYAVVITTGVKDAQGNPMGQGTFARILNLPDPVVVSGTSQLQGVDDTTAASIEAMRLQLQPVFALPQVGRANVAMAYTFRTQTILSQAVQLGALPYAKAAATPALALPTLATATPETPAQAFAKYGVFGTNKGGPVPLADIGSVFEPTITAFDLIDPATGAFSATQTVTDETINVLITAPPVTNTKVLTCSGALAALAPLKCAPMVVFRHGLGGGRADMLTVADTLAANGFVTVAIDAAKHGDRSFCTSGSASTTINGITVPQQCATGATCTTTLPPGAQGDTNPPGTCGTAGFAYNAVSPACFGNPAACGWAGTEGIPFVSSNYLVTSNFFRTRDTLRQDAIDESQLVQAIAFAPTGALPTPNPVFNAMAATGVVIDPTRIYFVGQSLGSIQGAMDVATNPRITEAVFNVGGGTAVDIFTTSPTFVTSTNALLASLGVTPGTSEYLQFLAVAKMTLDPADPINYAGHLSKNTLPNLLPPLGGNTNGSVPQSVKTILAQTAFCDQTVPNPWNYLFASNLGVGPFPGATSFGGPGNFQLYMTLPPGNTTGPTAATFTSCPSPPASGASDPWTVSHSFITAWTDAAQTGTAQNSAAVFLATPATLPLSLEVLP